MYGFAPCSKGRRMFRPMVLPPPSRAQRLQRALRPLAAVDACGAEKYDRVLDLLLLETAQRLQVLGEDPDRPRFLTLEELGIQIGDRLLRHEGQFTIRML